MRLRVRAEAHAGTGDVFGQARRFQIALEQGVEIDDQVAGVSTSSSDGDADLGRRADGGHRTRTLDKVSWPSDVGLAPGLESRLASSRPE